MGLGKLIIHCGGMFSGKTTALLSKGERYTYAKKKVKYFKPSIDHRSGSDVICNHNGVKIQALEITLDGRKILETEFDEVVLIDEVQFFDVEIVDHIKKLIEQKKIVVVAGLDMDYNSKPFETTMYLMSISDEVYKHKAICFECGNEATFSARISDSKKTIEIGEADKYIALCRNCYSKYKK